ncbi:jg23633 [Pararge aegeria aegeria]|uniref:Jg23633 protein n=1 Tax=Pararge aegeria aegeria TaxID=348720 RepID=A0A8S4SJ68_9NEOP|nr:jg23633 [Pararge aegeria aegeria]
MDCFHSQHNKIKLSIMSSKFMLTLLFALIFIVQVKAFHILAHEIDKCITTALGLLRPVASRFKSPVQRWNSMRRALSS